jgi:hypothetical protein
MAHYAKLDVDNRVLEVLVIDNDQEEELGEAGIVEWLKNNWGGVDWKKTSYNTTANTHSLGGTPFRKNYAGSCYTFDVDRDAFIPLQPFPSWVLDEDTCQWEAPVPRPDDGKDYDWNESTVSWDEVEEI